MTVNSELLVKVQSTDDGDVTSPIVGSFPANSEYDVKWPDGVAINTADERFFKRYSIAASGTQLLDLAGVLVDEFNRTKTFAKIKAIYVKNLSVTAGDTVTLGPDATNGMTTWLTGTTPAIPIDPGGVLLSTSPVDAWVVTGGSADELILTETGGANTVTVEVHIIGTSA